MLRRWRTYWIRRGRVGWVPPAEAPAAPSERPPGNLAQPGWRPRWPRALVRRGRLAEPPWPQAAAPPPAWVPEVAAQVSRRPVVAVRRGRVTLTPPEQVSPPPRPVRARLRLLPRARGGRITPVIPAPLAGGGGVPTPETIRRPEPRWLFQRRGRVTALPLVGAAQPAPPAYPPQTLRVDVRLLRTRRGELAEPPWPQAAPPPAWVPDAVTSRRPAGVRPRRGRQTQIPPQPTGIPASFRIRLRPAPSLRRGHLHEPPWPQVVPQPSVWRPNPARRTGAWPRFAAYQRRGNLCEPPWPQQAPTFVPPRWVEGTSITGTLVEGTANAAGIVEGATASAGGVEGSSSL